MLIMETKFHDEVYVTLGWVRVSFIFYGLRDDVWAPVASGTCYD